MATLSERFHGFIDRRFRHRRKNPRAAVSWPVTIITDNTTLKGQAENISRGGALVFLEGQLQLGEKVRLAFEIPDCRDVITASGDVVRVFTLKRGDESQFANGIGLKFTEITNENLKFFSGNLAPEWEKDYSELESIPRPKSTRPVIIRQYVLLALAVVCLSSLSYILIQSLTVKKGSVLTPEQLDTRLKIIEQQLSQYQTLNQSLKGIENEITRMKTELTQLKTALPSQDLLNELIGQLNAQSRQIEEVRGNVAQKLETGIGTISNASAAQQSEEHYHVVRKGENLYRISLQTGRTVEQLRKLNELEPNQPLLIGQKLRTQ